MTKNFMIVHMRKVHNNHCYSNNVWAGLILLIILLFPPIPLVSKEKHNWEALVNC